MSAFPIAIVRELGCEHRTFRTVRHALTWYRDQMASLMRVTRSLDRDTRPLSREAVDLNHATRARIRACLSGSHPADSDLASVPLRSMLPLHGELIVFLCAWYEGDWGDGSDLAKRAGLTRWSFHRRCQRTERILRGRMSEAGLI